MKKVDRREFLKWAGIGITAMAAQQFLSSCQKEIPTGQPPTQTPFTPEQSDTPVMEATPELPTPTPDYPYLVVAHGENPEEITRQGVKAIGGIERFMKPGADVIIKPNICVGYHTYEYAATTNPWVVGALVKLCLEAGAKRVRVMDYPFGGPAAQCYRMSGIEEQVLVNGGIMEEMQSIKYITLDIPDAKQLKQVTLYADVLETDLLINVPIAKDHGLAKLTLGMKNLMGTIEDRGAIHSSFQHKLVDLATLVKPQLTMIDAVRTLMANGPTGGNLADVKLQNTLIVSPDIVIADSYATTLFGMRPADIPYIMSAEKRGLGRTDFNSVKIEEFNVSV